MDPKEYQRYRRAYVDLKRKLMKTCLTPPVVMAAAAALGLSVSSGQGEPVLEVEDQLEFELATDFMLHEWHPEGQSLLADYARKPGGANKVERDLLKAAQAARASLYEVIARDSAAGELRLRDLLQPESGELTLTDQAISGWAVPGLRLFLRVLRLPGFSMSASPPMTFAAAFGTGKDLELPAGELPEALNHADASRYRRYFALYRREGLRDVRQPV